MDIASQIKQHFVQDFDLDMLVKQVSDNKLYAQLFFFFLVIFVRKFQLTSS